MSWLDNAKSFMDTSGLTNPSKLYTPFTLFCMFFAIYLNAEILGAIFLSGNWDIQQSALSKLSQKSWGDWVIFIGKVSALSLTVLAIYGLFQALAALIWTSANTINIRLSVLADKSRYVLKGLLDNEIEKNTNLCERERELQTKISEYHDWTPQKISKLKSDYAGLENQHSQKYELLLKAENKIEILSNSLKAIEMEKDKYFHEKIQLTSKNDQLSYQYSEIEKHNKYLIDKNNTLSKELDGKDVLITNLNKIIADSKNKINDLEKQIKLPKISSKKLVEEIANKLHLEKDLLK